MRKILGLAGMAAVSLFVASCNPPPLKAPVQQACNCNGTVDTANTGAENPRFTPPDSEPTPPARHHYASHRRHHYYGYRSHRSYDNGYRDYDSSASYSRTASYDYHSSSRVYYSSTRSSSYGYQGGYVNAPVYQDGWQDGYGRYHRGSAATGREHSARMDPWRGYDIDCPETRPYYTHGPHY
jgi:hypothetical protein